MENWKPIKDFSLYEVSDQGNVRNVVSGLILSGSPDSNGYLLVDLRRNRKRFNRKIHRLVAEAFLPNPDSLPEVNHTGRKQDNRAEKLEWRSTAGHGQDRALREQQGDGVNFHSTRKRWRATYRPATGIRKHIGWYKTFEEAKAARAAKLATVPRVV